MRILLFLSLLILTLLTSCNYKKKLSASYISLSPVYSSGMVLQTTPSTIIAGKANPGGVLAVKIHDYLRLGQADENGNWQVNFPEIILSESFSMSLEGIDTSITFNNIHVGKVYIIAGDSDLPVLPVFNDHGTFNQSSQPLRVFIPLLKGSTRPKYAFSGGKWHPLAEARKNNKTSRLLSSIPHLIADNDIPIGIIDLTWQGSMIESWLPVEDNLHLNHRIIESSSIDSCVSLNEKVLNQILAMKDTCMDGIKKGVTRTWYNDESWRKTELPVTIGEKDDIQKKRIVYLRKKIYVPEKYLSSNFYINLEHLHGVAQYYFNEKEIYPLLSPQERTQLVIPDSLMRVWTNILTIRLFCTDSVSGLYGEEFICHNADSSYYRAIDSDWKYSFDLESEFPKHTFLERINGLAHNSLLTPALNVNAESILFQFRNTTIDQTNDFSKKVCELLNTLPESWSISLAFQELTRADTIVYGIESAKIDSIYKEIYHTCEIEIDSI